jgi:hypothetical protein
MGDGNGEGIVHREAAMSRLQSRCGVGDRKVAEWESEGRGLIPCGYPESFDRQLGDRVIKRLKSPRALEQAASL